jgi:hypothetical protein
MNRKLIAAIVNADAETLFDLAEVAIELAADIGKQRRCVGIESDAFFCGGKSIQCRVSL